MSSGRTTLALPSILLAFAFLYSAVPAVGADQEGCMLCHRLELRLQTATGARSLKTHDSPGGSHSSLYCSDCHPDARAVPHPAPPGAAQCIGECHRGTSTSKATHRNAGFGGLTDGHRSMALPGTACRMCHRATDRNADRAAVRTRCATCHLEEVSEVARGPHGRVRGGSCVDCHPAHPAASAGAAIGKTSCSGDGCHGVPTPQMESLVRHRRGDGGSPVGSLPLHGAVILGFAAAGWFFGAAMTPRSTRKGDAS